MGPTIKKSGPIVLQLEFEGRQVHASGLCIRAGMIQSSAEKIVHLLGIKFEPKTLDSSKELGDFIEYLRSKGYASA
jgi:hypothetical protein